MTASFSFSFSVSFSEATRHLIESSCRLRAADAPCIYLVVRSSPSCTATISISPQNTDTHPISHLSTHPPGSCAFEHHFFKKDPSAAERDRDHVSPAVLSITVLQQSLFYLFSISICLRKRPLICHQIPKA